MGYIHIFMGYLGIHKGFNSPSINGFLCSKDGLEPDIVGWTSIQVINAPGDTFSLKFRARSCQKNGLGCEWCCDS